MEIVAVCLLLATLQGPDDWSRFAPAHERLRSGDRKGAIEEFTKLLDDDRLPLHLRVDALQQRAATWLTLGEPAKAVDDFTAAIELAPDESEAYYGRASAYEQQGDRALASADLAMARELHRHNVALAAGLTGDRQRAIAEFEQLRRDVPRFKLSRLVLGALYLDEGQPERALAIAEEIGSEMPGEVRSVMLAASSLQALGRLDEAQAAVDRALALEPKAGDACALAARLALDRGDASRAKELIQKAHQLAPGDAYVLCVQARIALATEDAASARQAVEKALEAIRANPFLLLSQEAVWLMEMLESQPA